MVTRDDEVLRGALRTSSSLLRETLGQSAEPKLVTPLGSPLAQRSIPVRYCILRVLASRDRYQGWVWALGTSS